jgi:hypothetical protein
MTEKVYYITEKDLTIIRAKCVHPYWEVCGEMNSCRFFIGGKCTFDVEKFISDLPKQMRLKKEEVNPIDEIESLLKCDNGAAWLASKEKCEGVCYGYMKGNHCGYDLINSTIREFKSGKIEE